MSCDINRLPVACAVWMLLLGQGAVCAEVLVERIGGQGVVAARGAALGGKAVNVTLADGSSESEVFPRDELISITFPGEGGRSTRPQGSLLVFANENRLIATKLDVRDDTVIADVRGQKIAIPIGQLRGIVWDASKTNAPWWPMMFRERGASDLIFLTNGDQSGGQFAGVTEAGVTLVLEGRTLAIPRERVAAIAFSPELISNPDLPAERQIVAGPWGQLTLTGLLGETNKTLKGRTLFGETIVFQPGEIQRIQFLGPRVVSLTDIKPRNIEFTPWLSRRWPARFNRGVTNRPLALGEDVYAWGIGVHSRTRITYRLDGGYDRFSVSAGLAKSAGSLGNVVIAVEVDGKTARRREEVTRASGAVRFDNISLKGAESLSLLVDFGSNGDIRDRVNWCAPVLIRGANAGT